MKNLRIIIMIALLLAIGGSIAFCQDVPVKKPVLAWEEGGVIINDSQGKSIRQNARTTSCDDGTFVVVWEDARNGYLDIYAQKLDKFGKELWGIDGIPVCTAVKNQSFPEVTCIGNSETVIVWQDYRDGYSDIYAQKLTANGTSLWEKDGKPICKATVNQISPKLTPDGHGGIIITWHDYRSGRGEDIYAQKVDKDNRIAWAEDGVGVCTSEGTQWYPKIIEAGIADGAGGAIIIWDDKRGEYYDIYAQRIDNNGRAVWQHNGMPICTAPENQDYSEIARDADGYVITWQDYRNGNSDIYAQKINDAGNIMWKVNGIAVSNILGNQERPKICGGKNVIITWEDYRNGPINADIYAQKIASDGTLLWDKYGVAVCETRDKQEDPNLISDGDEGALIYWKDSRGETPSVYARRVNKAGHPLWVKDGMPVCKAIEAEYPQVSRSGDIFTFVWQDKREGNVNISVQNIDMSGSCKWAVNGISISRNFGSVTQQKPRIVEVGGKEFIIVWEDYRNGFSNVYAQKINNEGQHLWGREGIRICGFDSDQVNPTLIADDAGGAIIVWQDERTKHSNIYAQEIDSSGKLMWGDDGVPMAAFDSNQLYPQIVGDDSGGAIISWLDNRNTDNALDVFAQRVDGAGSPQWKKEGIPVCTTYGLQTEQRNMKDGSGGVVITWTDFRRSLKNPDIYAQRISKLGELKWDANGVPVCKAPDTQRNPELAGKDSIIIAWEDSGSGNYDIYAQKINKNGTVAWTVDGIEVCAAKYTQHDPRLVYDNDGGAVIVWEDYRDTNWDIYAQRLDTNGTKLWTITGVPVCTARSTQYSPQLIMNNDSSSIVVWEDYRNERNYNIFATKLSPLGKNIWGSDGVPISASIEGARDPQIASDGEGGAVIVWTDFRFGNYDIYAQRINGEK